jgi:hypothetical protein
MAEGRGCSCTLHAGAQHVPNQLATAVSQPRAACLSCSMPEQLVCRAAWSLSSPTSCGRDRQEPYRPCLQHGLPDQRSWAEQFVVLGLYHPRLRSASCQSPSRAALSVLSAHITAAGPELVSQFNAFMSNQCLILPHLLLEHRGMGSVRTHLTVKPGLYAAPSFCHRSLFLSVQPQSFCAQLLCNLILLRRGARQSSGSCCQLQSCSCPFPACAAMAASPLTATAPLSSMAIPLLWLSSDLVDLQPWPQPVHRQLSERCPLLKADGATRMNLESRRFTVRAAMTLVGARRGPYKDFSAPSTVLQPAQNKTMHAWLMVSCCVACVQARWRRWPKPRASPARRWMWMPRLHAT